MKEQELQQGGKAFGLLLLAGAITFFLPSIPYGSYILWSFVILTTYIHEMGHGLTALLMGGNFLKLEIYSNASGLAWYSGVAKRLPSALVAAGGLVGPSLAEGLFILAGRTARNSSRAFLGLSLYMLVGTAIWVRSAYSLGAIGAMGLLF